MRLRPGMVLAIEPMVNAGGPHVKTDGPEILTRNDALWG